MNLTLQSDSAASRFYVHRRVPQRTAETVAEFPHPVTDAPMVTWYQTSEITGEEPEFYTSSKKEFLGWFSSKSGV